MKIRLQCDRKYIGSSDRSGFPTTVPFNEWVSAAHAAVAIGANPASLRVFEFARRYPNGSTVVVARTIAPTLLA